MGRRKKAFSLYLRRIRLPGKRTPVKVYYYRTYDLQGHRTVGRSTGKGTKSEADDYCRQLQERGELVSGPGPRPQSEIPTLEAWAKSEAWWQWGKCRYLRGQLARSDESKPAVSRRYAADALRDLKQWILPFHGEKRLDLIGPKDCEDMLFAWERGSASRKPLSKKSINNRASIERIMLAEAERLGIIERNPWDRVRGFKPAKRPKGILSLAEARKLLNPATLSGHWKGNQVYYSASLLAAVTGMRLGEVLALKREHLFPDHVHVAGSWGKLGLQPTKTKRVDDIPIPGFVHRTIASWCEWEGFIFSFKLGARPASGNRCNDALIEALKKIGIPEEERRQRRLSYHSWRAFANTYMRARGISGEKVRELTRHASEEMTEHYSAFSLEHFKDVARAQEDLVASMTAAGGDG